MRLFVLVGALLTLGPLYAAGAETCRSAQDLFSVIANSSRVVELSPMNLDQHLELLLASLADDTNPALKPLLRMALENAYQHGVEDMYLPSLAKVRIEIKSVGEFTEIRISNPLHKKFPARLEQTFSPGDSVSLSHEERPFPRGMGVGLGQMFRSFSQFDRNSQMRWINQNDTEATFLLRFPTHSAK